MKDFDQEGWMGEGEIKSVALGCGGEAPICLHQNSPLGHCSFSVSGEGPPPPPPPPQSANSSEKKKKQHSCVWAKKSSLLYVSNFLFFCFYLFTKVHRLYGLSLLYQERRHPFHHMFSFFVEMNEFWFENLNCWTVGTIISIYEPKLKAVVFTGKKKIT